MVARPYNARAVDSTYSEYVFLADETATLAFGARLGRALAPGLRIYLRGDLGAGKTTLVRGLLRGLGYPGKVKSPTYTLVELYKISNLCLYHFDFYRFEKSSEWEEAGFREHFGPEGTCLVEWPERAAGALPPPDLVLRFTIPDSGRGIGLTASSEAGAACLQRMRDSQGA